MSVKILIYVELHMDYSVVLLFFALTANGRGYGHMAACGRFKLQPGQIVHAGGAPSKCTSASQCT